MEVMRPRTTWVVLLIGLLCVGLLAACSGGATPAPGAVAPGLTVENAFARPAPAGGAGGAFLTVINAGSEADRLIAVRSPAAPTTELHETIDDNGVMKMRHAPAGFEVPANGKLELKPGGKHVMFMGLTSALTEGGQVEMTLTFEKAGEITIQAPIRQ